MVMSSGSWRKGQGCRYTQPWRVAGFSLRDRVKSSDIQSRATAPWHWKKPIEVFRASDQTLTPPPHLPPPQVVGATANYCRNQLHKSHQPYLVQNQWSLLFPLLQQSEIQPSLVLLAAACPTQLRPPVLATKALEPLSPELSTQAWHCLFWPFWFWLVPTYNSTKACNICNPPGQFSKLFKHKLGQTCRNRHSLGGQTYLWRDPYPADWLSSSSLLSCPEVGWSDSPSKHCRSGRKCIN